MGIDPTSVEYFKKDYYFTTHEKAMREVGLDPDDDDDWAIPDYELNEPTSREYLNDGFIFGEREQTYATYAWIMCTRCFEDFISNDPEKSELCLMCQYEHDRQES